MSNAIRGRTATAWTRLAAVIADDGSAAHPHLRRLLAPRVERRDLADAVHGLCMVHGRHPGLIDAALARCVQPNACHWLANAAAGFAVERAALAQLVAAAGPLPSTPGQAETEAALAGVRHAAEMLAKSDRGGCATGAAAALTGDWIRIRLLLERAADTFAVVLPPSTLPDIDETEAAVAMLVTTPMVERALLFGATQLLAQHRGVWDLLDARASARS